MTAPAEDGGARTRGERLRRVVLSAAFVVWLAGILVVALVGAPGLRSLARHAQPGVTLAGLDQDWRLFAPEPPRAAQRLEVATLWSDGSRTVWRFSPGNPWLAAYADYRWRKWAENAGSDAYGPRLWAPAARFVLAREPARRGAHPVELRVLRRTTPLAPVGQRRSPAWVTTELYRARVSVGAS